MPELSQHHAAPTLASLAPFFLRPLFHQGQKIEGRPMGSYIFAYPTPQKNPDMSRLYVPGDPLKYIDWKAFGRTDQLLIRSKKEEVNATVYIAIDGSTSMRWPEEIPANPGQVPSKLSIGFRIACHLASLHIYNGDRVFLIYYAFPDSLISGRSVELKSLSQVHNFFNVGLNLTEDIRKVFDDYQTISLSSYDIGYWISDGIDLQLGFEFLNLARKGIFFQILSSLELDHSWLKKNEGYAATDAIDAPKYSGSDLLDRHSCLTQIEKWLQGISAEAQALGRLHHVLTDSSLISYYFQIIMDFGVIRRLAW